MLGRREHLITGDVLQCFDGQIEKLLSKASTDTLLLNLDTDE